MLSFRRLEPRRRRFYVGRVESSRPAVFVVGDAVRRLDGAFDWASDDAGSRMPAAGLLLGRLWAPPVERARRALPPRRRRPAARRRLRARRHYVEH